MKRTSYPVLPVLVWSAGAALIFVGCSSNSTDQPSGPGLAGGGNHNQAGGTTTAGVGQGGSSSSAGQSSSGASNGGSGVAGTTSAAAGASASGGAAGKAGAGGDASSGSGGGGSTTPGMSAGCGRAPTIASNMYNNGKNIPITVGSMQRRYILSVPTNYSNSKPYKLIIAYHQRDGNDNQMYINKYYHLQPLSNDTTIFVAPNGQLNGAPCSGAGNGESGCGWPNTNDTDMKFADAVVKAVEDSFCIDTNRIFATGWSYGGSMSYASACERPLGATNGFIRAVAVYSGSQLSGNCTPTKPVAYYASHGTADNVLCYDETKSAGCQVGNGLLLAQNFAKANGCTWMTPQKVTSGNHVCTTLMGCASGYPEVFCSFNGSHTPDPSDSGQPSWEYQKAWDFLNQF